MLKKNRPCPDRKQPLQSRYVPFGLYPTLHEAKKDLEKRAGNIDSSLKEIGGAAYVSVNKGLVTRSSAVIPIISLYLGVLFKIMKKMGTHEGCVEQMERLFAERLFTGENSAAGKVPVDEANRIRIDDWELDPKDFNMLRTVLFTFAATYTLVCKGAVFS